ncbi:MAG: DUF3426 domain-containing protein [Gammaproteobacteria bacterium]|nr:DUF3426 domain-containing protein [Gammaproteobacteria bacterium]
MHVLISCPNCNTSYQIEEKQLQESDGQARCYHCQSVFNAVANSQPVTEEANLDNLNLPSSADLYDKSPASPRSRGIDEFTDRELSSLFIPDAQSEIVSGPDDIQPQDSSLLLPEELLDIEAENVPPIEPLSAEQQLKNDEQQQSSAAAAWGWGIGIILLLVVFIAQGAWLNRHQLLLNPEARNLIESLCENRPCNLPPRRNPDAFKVIERKVTIHPEIKDILSISILFANQADFAQPAPGVTLTLFNNQQELIARRSFTHKDYLDHYSRKAPIFNPGQTQTFFLNLEDPGSDVTGFEFNFF